MPLPALLIPPGHRRRLSRGPRRLRSCGATSGSTRCAPSCRSWSRATGKRSCRCTTSKCISATGLGVPEPEYPASLQDNETLPEAPPLWRRVLRRRKRTVADGSPHSRTSIIGRQGAGFAAGTVWKVWSATVLNIVRPMGAKLLTLFPGAAPAVGTTSSLAFGISLRFALGIVSVAAFIVGPLLLAFAVIREVRKVRKARHELETIRRRRHKELATYRSRTRLLQRNVRMRAYTSCRVRHRVRHAGVHASRRRRSSRAAARPGRPAATAPAQR